MKNRTRKRWLNVIGLAVVLATVRCSLQPDGATSPTGTTGGVGKLRVLITDKPFPFSMVEEAWVKITKVEVRRGADEASSCETEEDCADELFCNGSETCVDGACVEGSAPCEEPLVCDEALTDCVTPSTQDDEPTVCTTEADCADELFCNGSETCVDGACVEGTNPCDESLVCDEALAECVTPSTQDDDGDDEEDGGSPFVVIFEGEKDFNLLELQNGRTDLLAEMDVPAGTYTQMRLFVTEGTIKLFDVEEPFVLKVPSGAQTGIKLRFTFTVEDGETTTLLVDVDLSKAFVPIPGGRIENPTDIRSFKFHPSLAVRVVNLEEVGSISGSVVDEEGAPIGGVNVTAFNSDDVTSTGTEDDGTFTLGGLPPDTYRLEFFSIDFNDADVADVVVVADETTALDPVVMTMP